LSLSLLSLESCNTIYLEYQVLELVEYQEQNTEYTQNCHDLAILPSQYLYFFSFSFLSRLITQGRSAGKYYMTMSHIT